MRLKVVELQNRFHQFDFPASGKQHRCQGKTFTYVSISSTFQRVESQHTSRHIHVDMQVSISSTFQRVESHQCHFALIELLSFPLVRLSSEWKGSGILIDGVCENCFHQFDFPASGKFTIVYIAAQLAQCFHQFDFPASGKCLKGGLLSNGTRSFHQFDFPASGKEINVCGPRRMTGFHQFDFPASGKISGQT